MLYAIIHLIYMEPIMEICTILHIITLGEKYQQLQICNIKQYSLRITIISVIACFHFEKNGGTSFVCALLSDTKCYFEAKNSPLYSCVIQTLKIVQISSDRSYSSINYMGKFQIAIKFCYLRDAISCRMIDVPVQTFNFFIYLLF